MKVYFSLILGWIVAIIIITSTGNRWTSRGVVFQLLLLLIYLIVAAYQETPSMRLRRKKKEKYV